MMYRLAQKEVQHTCM